MSRKTRQLIRSVLFCPTDKISLIEKALGIGKNSSLIADVVVLDLEDSVSPTMKERARDNIVQVMNNISEYSDRRRLPKIVVRINFSLTTEWGIEDLKLTAKVNADAILIPKVNNSFELQRTLSLRQSSRTIPIWAMVETAKGVLNAPTIADDLNIEALVFGSNDLTKDLKSFSVKDRMPLLYSMSHCILAARAAGKQVVDGVFMDIKDDDGFRDECMTGKNLGFDGNNEEPRDSLKQMLSFLCTTYRKIFDTSESSANLQRNVLSVSCRAAACDTSRRSVWLCAGPGERRGSARQ